MDLCLLAPDEVPLNQGNYVRAGELYRQALAIMRQIGDRREPPPNSRISDWVTLNGATSPPLTKCFAESLENYTLAGDRNGIVLVTGNSGNLYRAEGKRLLSATNHLDEAEQTARRVLGQIELKRNASAGRRPLDDLVKTARAKGFERIAQKPSDCSDTPNAASSQCRQLVDSPSNRSSAIAGVSIERV